MTEQQKIGQVKILEASSGTKWFGFYLRLYRPPLAVEIPIFYEEGMTVAISVNADGDTYMLLTNPLGSEECAQ